jgi:hypothetical protein
VVFKRRDRRPFWKIVADFLWPKGGWSRAFHYVKHRLRRLPDPPHRIARGIFAGIFVTFSPLFGFHFLAAIGLAWILRGNLIASLLATFVGNPLTFVPIAAISIRTGYFLLGKDDGERRVMESLGRAFTQAWMDLKANVWAAFTPAEADWDRLSVFFDDVFLPYLVGGILPGLIFGMIGYYVSLPLIAAYQNRRRGLIKAKWEALKEKAATNNDAEGDRDYSSRESDD